MYNLNSMSVLEGKDLKAEVQCVVCGNPATQGRDAESNRYCRLKNFVNVFLAVFIAFYIFKS